MRIGKGISIRDSRVGINFTGNDFPGGSLTLLDCEFDNVGTGVLLDQNPLVSKEQSTLILLNVAYRNTDVVADSHVSGARLRGGSSGRVESWFIGYTYRESELQIKAGVFADGVGGGSLGVELDTPDSLLFTGPANAGYFTRSRPQYEDTTEWTVATDAKGMYRKPS